MIRDHDDSPRTLDPQLDGPRIATLLETVRDVMERGLWLTLEEIQGYCDRRGAHGSEAGISARLRDLRKPEHGRRTVERRRRGDPRAGLWEYRLAPLYATGEQMRLGGLS